MVQLLQVRRTIAAIALLLLSSVWVYAQQNLKQAAKDAKVSPSLYGVIANNGNLNFGDNGPLKRVNLFMTEGDKIAIDAIANSEQENGALLQALEGMGLQKGRIDKKRVTGYLPVSQLGNLKGIASLRLARPLSRPKNNAGSVLSQGDASLRADIARTTYNVNGAGVKVGILSDSYNARGGAAAGVASGDLPAGVEVLSDLTGSNNSDEGRAMAELVHDIAPGSPIAFHTAFVSETDFAQGIIDLANAGCKIITDDVSYFTEPFFQDGVIAQAIDYVVNTMGVTYFSSAGNSGRQSYQSGFNPSVPTVFPGYVTGNASFVAQNFGGGDVRQTIRLSPGQTFIYSFQWDDDFASASGGAGAQTDMDILVYYNGSLIDNLSGLEINEDGDAVEFNGFQNNTSSTIEVELALVKYSGPNPSIIKWVNFADPTFVEYDTKSSTAVGHTNGERCISVGAAPYYNTPAFNNGLATAVIEPFSSVGGTPIYFTTNGTRLGSPIIRQKPEITAVDGTNTTFFFADSPSDSDSYPNFFGTSAAAPHAAAVAALMKQKVPSITPATILTTLQTTSLDMDDPSTPGFDSGFDFNTGFGFIQANRALEAISETPPPAGVFSITGVTTVSCTIISPGRRQLTFNPTYEGLTGQPVSFSVLNELAPTTAPGPYSLALYTDNPVIVLKANQSGVETTFNYNWLGACGGNPTPPPSVGFAIVGANTISCTSAGPGARTITFLPQYSGVNNQPISFSVANEMMPTTAPGPYTLTLYTDNPVITLKAVQQGTPDQGSYSFNWLAACNSQTSGARVGASELTLSVRLLGNPVVGESAEVEIAGASGGPVSVNLVDVQGRSLHQHNINEAASLERVRIPLNGRKGLLMLNVSTPADRKTIKLIKQ